MKYTLDTDKYMNQKLDKAFGIFIDRNKHLSKEELLIKFTYVVFGSFKWQYTPLLPMNYLKNQ